MTTIHFIEVEQRDLLKATDMLRYDSCYNVQRVGHTTYRLSCMQFTPARWRSFNAVAVETGTVNVTNKVGTELYIQAAGLTTGLRLAQHFVAELPEWQQYRHFVEGKLEASNA